MHSVVSYLKYINYFKVIIILLKFNNTIYVSMCDKYFKYLYLILTFKNYNLIICILLHCHKAISLTFKIIYNLYCNFEG